MATKSKKALLCVIGEIFLILAVGIPSIMMRKFLTPFHRGFFQSDESLMYKFKPSTVTNVMLYSVGFLLPITVVMLVEGVIVKTGSKLRRKFQGSLKAEGSLIGAWAGQCFGIVSAFLFGAAATHLLTNIPKYSIGRLRPHFFDVCVPDWSMLNSTAGYIEEDICQGTDDDRITEARLSFPSGHSSMSMYCAIFLIIYLYKRFTWSGIRLLKPLFQLVIFCLALYTCLSRISDYKHHGGDVLAGGVLGATIAYLIISKVARVTNHGEKDKKGTVLSDSEFLPVNSENPTVPNVYSTNF